MQRLVKVDGKTRTDATYPAGFMDVIEIPKTDEHFRLIYDTKGRFVCHRVTKVCRKAMHACFVTLQALMLGTVGCVSSKALRDGSEAGLSKLAKLFVEDLQFWFSPLEPKCGVKLGCGEHVPPKDVLRDNCADKGATTIITWLMRLSSGDSSPAHSEGPERLCEASPHVDITLACRKSRHISC